MWAGLPSPRAAIARLADQPGELADPGKRTANAALLQAADHRLELELAGLLAGLTGEKDSDAAVLAVVEKGHAWLAHETVTVEGANPPSR